MPKTFAALCAALCLATVAQAGPIRGDYMEARTADIYTGPCFSNSEIFLTGNQAVVAWKVTEGSWNGVDLAGLSVAAAIRGTTTFSEDKPDQARAIVIVDQQANSTQREALIAMAKALAGGRLNQIIAIKSATIAFTVEPHDMMDGGDSAEHERPHEMPRAPRAFFWAPGLAEISTRPFEHTDHVCGNETVAYAPLSKGVEVLPAYTLSHRFQVPGLNTTWNDPNCRSSFVGQFSY
jgi:hypothetical protein